MPATYRRAPLREETGEGFLPPRRNHNKLFDGKKSSGETDEGQGYKRGEALKPALSDAKGARGAGDVPPNDTNPVGFSLTPLGGVWACLPVGRGERAIHGNRARDRWSSESLRVTSPASS